MAKGRKPGQTPEQPADELDRDELQRKAEALNAVSAHSGAVADLYGDGVPYDRSRCISEARFFMAQSAEAMLELGKRLIQIKENEPHGEFVEIVEQRLGIPSRTAQRFMAASVKFIAPAAKAPALALLGKTKLFELLDETDEAIEALADGGTLAGLDLDDMQTMTSRELRAALVEDRKKLAAKDKLIAKKDEKLNQLAEEAEARRAAPLPEAEAAQVEELRIFTLEAEVALQRLLASVDEVTRQPATEAAEVCARHSLDYLVQRIVDGCLQRGITVDLADRVAPIWLEPMTKVAEQGKTARNRK